MPDVLINAGVPRMFAIFQPQNTVEIGNTVYEFFLTATDIIVYRKSLDRGATWLAAVTVHDGSAGGFDIKKVNIWFDQWTPGITGDLIHIAIISRAAAANERNYFHLDTSTDTLTGPVAIGSGDVNALLTWNRSCIAMVKARNDDIYIGGWVSNGGLSQDWLIRSGDNGATWTAAGTLASPVINAFLVDKILFLPGNETDQQDIWCIYQQFATANVILRLYDASADGWSGTTITTLTGSSTSLWQFGAATRFSDGHVFLAQQVTSSIPTDVVIFEINSAVSFTARANVDTAGNCINPQVHIDQATGAIRVAWLDNVGGFPLALANVITRLSTDGAVSWAGEVQFNEDAADDHRWLGLAPSTPAAGGLFIPTWLNDDNSQLLTNVGLPLGAGVPFGPGSQQKLLLL